MGFPWGAVLPQIVVVFLQALLQPFFLVVIVLIWLMYRRMQNTREALFGVRDSTLRLVLTALGYGIAGGLVGSVLIVVLGISINDIGIIYLWILAVLLMLVDPRFLCFSYAGGILALISLLTGYPKLNIPALMGLVAVLHLVESMLILGSGHIDPLPVYVRNRFGRVVGAFNLQKFWPIPLAIIAVATTAQAPAGGVAMPGWWPLLGGWGRCRPASRLASFRWWLPWAMGNWPSPACPGSGSRSPHCTWPCSASSCWGWRSWPPTFLKRRSWPPCSPPSATRWSSMPDDARSWRASPGLSRPGAG